MFELKKDVDNLEIFLIEKCEASLTVWSLFHGHPPVLSKLRECYIVDWYYWS